MTAADNTVRGCYGAHYKRKDNIMGTRPIVDCLLQSNEIVRGFIASPGNISCMAKNGFAEIDQRLASINITDDYIDGVPDQYYCRAGIDSNECRQTASTVYSGLMREMDSMIQEATDRFSNRSPELVTVTGQNGKAYQDLVWGKDGLKMTCHGYEPNQPYLACMLGMDLETADRKYSFMDSSVFAPDLFEVAKASIDQNILLPEPSRGGQQSNTSRVRLINGAAPLQASYEEEIKHAVSGESSFSTNGNTGGTITVDGSDQSKITQGDWIIIGTLANSIAKDQFKPESYSIILSASWQDIQLQTEAHMTKKVVVSIRLVGEPIIEGTSPQIEFQSQNCFDKVENEEERNNAIQLVFSRLARGLPGQWANEQRRRQSSVGR